jgi:hypothetical protein
MGLGGLVRRQWIAFVLVLFATFAVGLAFKRATPLYASTGTVAFSLPISMQTAVSPVGSDNLIVTADVVAAAVSGPLGVQQVRAAGGTGSYQFGLVNFYDQEYPNYAQPIASLQASSYQPAVAQRTFVAALSVIGKRLQSQQIAAGASPNAFITASLEGGSPQPIAQSGYPKRTYVGLLFLGIIAAYLLAATLDRHPSWGARLRVLLRRGGA